MHGNRLLVLALAAMTGLGSTVSTASAQEKTNLPRRDFGKRMIESPLERTLAPTGALPILPLLPIRQILQNADAKANALFVNPKVAPGQVIWHQNFAEACASAKTSGKAVLLFQMMGKLDDQFC
jgi:hypothetical protein